MNQVQEIVCPVCHGTGRLTEPERMDPAELVTLRSELGAARGTGKPASWEALAQALSVSPRTLRRYVMGDRPVSDTLAHRVKDLRARLDRLTEENGAE